MPSQQQQRRLQLVSFENDLDSLHLALLHTQWFKHLRHAAPKGLLANNRWESASGNIEWLLLPGDFMQRKHDAPAPDIVFFDPFSFKADTALWTLQAFCELAQVCQLETTIALSPMAAALPHGRELLGPEWLGKWLRSDAQVPMGAGADDEWRKAISGHSQFAAGAPA
jgi:queuine tRNA-ribosyltransferase